MDMRIMRTIAPWTLLFFLTCSFAGAQDAPPRLEVFAQGGGSFLNNGTGGEVSIQCLVCATGSSPNLGYVGPLTGSFSKTGRLFAGARLRFTRHDALEASYSYSPNHFSLAVGTQSFGSAYNRVNLISFNYVRYLWLRTRLQPFATAGLGTNHFSGPASASAVVSGLVSANNGYQFAWNYGGGADFVLHRHLALRLELRDYVTRQPSFINGTSHNVVPSAGIVFRFK
jgi:opacity protein-like surface antigen